MKKEDEMTIYCKRDSIFTRLYINAFGSDYLPDNICSFSYKILLSFILLIICWPTFLLNTISNRVKFTDDGYGIKSPLAHHHLAGLILHVFLLPFGLYFTQKFLDIDDNIIATIFLSEILGSIFMLLFAILGIVCIIAVVGIFNILERIEPMLSEMIKNIKIKKIRIRIFTRLKENNCLKIKWK